MSTINVSLDNPYGQVNIPRAKLHSSDDTVIANPMAVGGTDGNPYGTSSFAPPPYVVKEDTTEEVGGCRACCYRCRRKKWRPHQQEVISERQDVMSQCHYLLSGGWFCPSPEETREGRKKGRREGKKNQMRREFMNSRKLLRTVAIFSIKGHEDWSRVQSWTANRGEVTSAAAAPTPRLILNFIVNEQLILFQLF